MVPPWQHAAMDTAQEPAPQGLIQRLGLAAGPIAAAMLVLWSHPAAAGHGGLSAEASWVLGLAGWMAIWWLTEAVRLSLTALLPIMLPLVGVGGFAEAVRPYFDGIIFLFAGSCVMGMALDRRGVSERFVRVLLGVAGSHPVAIVGALLLASMCVSGFISNMATTVMMLPLALAAADRCRAVEGILPEASRRASSNFAAAALMCVAYGSTIGGAATLIGSPPNMIAAEWLKAQGQPLDFAAWARVGVPIAITVAPLTLLLMVWCLPMRGVRIEAAPRSEIRPFSRASWIATAVFALAVLGWTTPPLWPAGWRVPGLTDASVAVTAAVLLLVLPAGGQQGGAVVPWRWTRDLPWGVLLLFGGGLALSDAMQRSGLAASIGASVGSWGQLHPTLTVVLVVGTLCFASEIASNTALTAAAVPVLGPLATALGLPARTVAMATALGASYAFMLPVGTPPNALVYATGRVSMRNMMRVGFQLDLFSIAVITVWIRWLG
jgi:sodium-dependent dicarboxylate transporter 2/3/5